MNDIDFATGIITTLTTVANSILGGLATMLGFDMSGEQVTYLLTAIALSLIVWKLDNILGMIKTYGRIGLGLLIIYLAMKAFAWI